jgi:hypothetical protein
MSYNLFLDDDREPWQVGNYMRPVELRAQYRLEEWVVVRSYNEFIGTIARMGIPKKVSFDHDLCDEHYMVVVANFPTEDNHPSLRERTGLDCAKYLALVCATGYGKVFPEYYVHSMNPVGKENIISYIENHKNEVRIQGNKHRK